MSSLPSPGLDSGLLFFRSIQHDHSESPQPSRKGHTQRSFFYYFAMIKNLLKMSTGGYLMASSAFLRPGKDYHHVTK